jgi:hypothetical protein
MPIMRNHGWNALVHQPAWLLAACFLAATSSCGGGSTATPSPMPSLPGSPSPPGNPSPSPPPANPKPPSNPSPPPADAAPPADAGSTGIVGGGDAAPPPPSAPRGQCDPALETIQVGGAGPVAFKTSLDKDATYLLKAVGTVSAGNQTFDAEFAVAGGMGTDEMGGTDVGIDVGLLWPNRPNRFTQVPAGPRRMKWNPVPQINNNVVTPGAAFRADATYYMVVIGAGKPLSLKLVLPAGATATGTIAVSAWTLSPGPPARFTPMHSTMPAAPPAPKTCGTALDSIFVPAQAPTVAMGKFTTEANTMYLIQASGTAPVGAGALGDGDAEYMDFGADFTVNGFNDGEACTDFGLGVDELMVSHCGNNNTCIHRKNWWGTVGVDASMTTARFNSPTYRNDHIYYLLYTGTGKPVSFLYFDSGYGDNQPAASVLARVFALP